MAARSHSIRPEPTCLNPLCSVPDPVVTQVLEGAFEVGPDLVFRPKPRLGGDIDSKRPFVLTYHIRPEARWSDGVPVTASDFRFTQEAFEKYPTPVADLRQLYGRVRRTQVVNAKTFRIELQEPFARWRDLYSVVLPRHALVGEDLTRVWATASTTRRRVGRSGAGLSSSGAGSAAWSSFRCATPATGGSHVAHLDRFVSRFVRASLRRRRSSG